MALNILKCNHLTPLHFKGLNISLPVTFLLHDEKQRFFIQNVSQTVENVESSQSINHVITGVPSTCSSRAVVYRLAIVSAV